MRREIIRGASAFLAAVLIASGGFLKNDAAEAENDGGASLAVSSDFADYRGYIKKSAEKEKSNETVGVSIEDYKSNGSDVELKGGALFWKDGNGEISFGVSVSKPALYNIEIVWKPIDIGTDFTLGVKLDGAYPFAEAEEIVLKRMWKNATENPRTDAQGNEYAPEQIETGTYIKTVLADTVGIVTEPYMFALSAGAHVLTLAKPEQGVQIKEILFSAPEDQKTYAAALSEYSLSESGAEIITLQGEKADIKSSQSMIPKANNSDAGMTPSDAYTVKINYIGGTAWQKPGESITWKFSAQTAGYYYFHVRYKQSELVNGESLRWLKIDGKTPFKEAKSLKFPYGAVWKYQTFGKDGDPYYFWLDAGEHTLTLEVTAGGQAEYFARLSDIVDVLGDEYIKIVMITSENPDVNRDYELFNQIPDFNETLTGCRDSLTELAGDMKETAGKKSTQTIASMENMARVLNSMLRSPYVAQQYVKDYYNNYTSLSSWLYDMTNMPLAIDEIQLVPYGKTPINKNAGFIKSVCFGFTGFLSSFTADYSLTSDKTENNGQSIRLWVNWGQDQAAVLSSLIEDSFTAETGINVKLEIVSASLVNGILSGNFPDLALHMARTEPVNLGMRGALADLTQFEDYEEVLERFMQGAEIPYRYQDALYALPDTQSFFLMYYRTDIFENLGLKVPETWTDFLDAATVIQRNNMSVYMPYTQITANTTVNAGIGSLSLFPTLMVQNGLSLYNEEGNSTALNNKAAIDVFEFLTDFYTEYDLYKEADFYNRFRVGVMPLGIAPYATYMTLTSAAPEINGRWSISPVPGTDSGNRNVAGAGTGCAIIEKSENKDAAWSFLKWWTSAETQSRYSRNVESILGMIGRTATSNVEAITKLSWESRDLGVFLEQWSLVNEMPEVPGSYYLTRAVDQAFWSVVNGDSTAKDAIAKWSKVADDEITRKIKEYS